MLDSRTLTTVDGYAARIEAIADEMQSAGIAAEHRTGAPAILADVARDLRLATRELERIPVGIRIDRIAAFAPRHLQAAGERADISEPIRKLFAAAAVPLPPKGSTVPPATIDMVLSKNNIGVVDRMRLKAAMESEGVVSYSYTGMAAKP